MNLKEKIAVVTGATGGIGFEVAKRLGKDGYTVVLNGIEDDKGAERVKELGADGIEAEYYGFDVTDEQAVDSNIKAIGEKYGKIDVLVNNAGGLGGRSRFEEMTTDFYRSVMALNLDSAFFASRAAIPFLKKSENASIINYTSIAGWNAGGPGAGIYGTSKAGRTRADQGIGQGFGRIRDSGQCGIPGYHRYAISRPDQIDQARSVRLMEEQHLVG